MLEDSISIDNLENDNIEAHIIPIEEIFKIVINRTKP